MDDISFFSLHRRSSIVYRPLLLLGIKYAIDICYMFHPGTTLSVLQLEYLFQGPVKIVGYVGYLFPELVRRVAAYSPDGTSSTSNWWLQLGHTAGIVAYSDSLIRL